MKIVLLEVKLVMMRTVRLTPVTARRVVRLRKMKNWRRMRMKMTEMRRRMTRKMMMEAVTTMVTSRTSIFTTLTIRS